MGGTARVMGGLTPSKKTTAAGVSGRTLRFKMNPLKHAPTRNK
jgi:hypothetical protein